METIDYAVLGAYIVVLMALGVWLARRAAVDSDNYFLGGRKLPW